MCRRFESAPRHQARNATSCMLPTLHFRGPRLSTRRTSLGAEGGESNPHGPSPKVFETFASTIPPLRQLNYDSIATREPT